MTTVHRVLYPEPVGSLDEYVQQHDGGEALVAARKVEPEVLIAELEASGLRGRGGAGFPTGTKWRTVAEHRSEALPATVVVNAAEGEPGTFKDRTILRTNPYPVLEGALIAARAVGADQVVFATKATFTTEVQRLRTAIDEAQAAGWIEAGVSVKIFEGPSEYLYGEETALLEAMAGRQPFPRITPPFRRGVDEVVDTHDEATSESGLSAPINMAGPTGDDVAPPTLVDNVETLANVPQIVARGAAWFRELGTDDSPGTIVCTVTGSVKRPGVGEVPLGTPLREVIEAVAGGPRHGRTIRAVLSGVASGFVTGDELDTPVSYEAMQEIGSGVGSGGFMVFDDADDITAVAAGVSRFLAIESCGQCQPCKQDGLTLSDALARLSRGEGDGTDVEVIAQRAQTVGDRARCYLALQHQAVVSSLVERFPDDLRAHATGAVEPAEPVLVAELVEVQGNKVLIDERFAEKQPDWSYDEEWSGTMPADRFSDHRLDEETSLTG
jgi:NADH-quinone oxidoreductase subunit F